MDDAEHGPLLDRLWSEVEAADDAELDAARRAALQRAIPEIEAMFERFGDTRSAYLLGYAYYIHPDRRDSPEIQLRTESSFRTVLREVPNEPFAQLYLGHHAYDLARYTEAESHFRAVDASALDTVLRLKLCEILLCCHLRLATEPCVEEVERFVEACSSHPLRGVYPPLNLSRVIRELKPARPREWLSSVRGSLLRLDEIHGSEWFRYDLDAD